MSSNNPGRTAVGAVLALGAAAVLSGCGSGGSGAVREAIDTSLFAAGGEIAPRLVKQIVLDTPVESAFRAWTTPEGIGGALQVEADIRLAIGGAMELYFGADLPAGQRGSEGCQILSYIPGEMLSFSWNAPPQFPAERSRRTWVVVTFTPVGSDRCRLELSHLGFGEGGRWEEVVAYFDRAWGNFLAALADHFGAAAANEAVTVDEADLFRLARWLTGSFSSQEQAEADSGYFDIRLQMVPIWPDRDDGIWLYVEQAAAGSLDRPYRQRVYRLQTAGEGFLESVVHLLPGPERFVGAWREPDLFGSLAPDSLTIRDGCSILLREGPDGSFFGSTEGNACTSSLRGARYATSEVTITSEAVVSWDRGFDQADRQVWGATGGGYVFRRVASFPAGIDGDPVKEKLLRTDREFSAVSASEGIPAAFDRFAAPEAVLYRDGVHPLKGRAAIHALFEGASGSLTWEPFFADLAASGDLGYTLGRYRYRPAPSSGDGSESHGYYVSIWRKQPDGSWKYVFDSGVSGPSPGE